MGEKLTINIESENKLSKTVKTNKLSYNRNQLKCEWILQLKSKSLELFECIMYVISY